jgi:hypothetical protein
MLRRDDFDRLAVPIGEWKSLVEAGAFALPFDHPSQVADVVGNTILFDPFTAEIETLRYRGSDVGVNRHDDGTTLPPRSRDHPCGGGSSSATN